MNLDVFIGRTPAFFDKESYLLDLSPLPRDDGSPDFIRSSAGLVHAVG
jgi:hypothetical protein